MVLKTIKFNDQKVHGGLGVNESGKMVLKPSSVG